ncbi:hypothetical protein CRD60_08550, partial [Bifidobacterium aemilianum]
EATPGPVGSAIRSRRGKWQSFLGLPIVGVPCFMTFFWAVVIMMQQAPTLAILLTIMFVSGAFGAINGPIVQAMPFALPDIRGK